jgi:hypothetical protein
MLSLTRRGSGTIAAKHVKGRLKTTMRVLCSSPYCYISPPIRRIYPSCQDVCFLSSSTQQHDDNPTLSISRTNNNNTKVKTFPSRNHGPRPIQQPASNPHIKNNTTPKDNSHDTGTAAGASIPRRYVEATNELVGNQTAKWTIEDWMLADSTLKGWSQQPHVSSTSVQLCWDLLERMVLEAEREQKRKHHPRKQQQHHSLPPKRFNTTTHKLTTRHLNFAVDHWRIASRYRNRLDARIWSAPQVLVRIEDYSSRIPSLCPDHKTWTMLMAVQTKQNPVLAPAFCRHVLQRMTISAPLSLLSPSSAFTATKTTTAAATTMTVPSTTLRPNASVLTQVMDAYVKSGDPEAPMAVQSIFDYMVEQSATATTSQYKNEISPTEHSLTRLLQAWVLGGGGGGGVRIPGSTGNPSKDSSQYTKLALEKMGDSLHYMLQATKNIPGTLPSSLFLNLVLNACLEKTKSSSQEFTISYATMVPLADALLTRVYDESGINHPKLAPDGKAYADMITLWSKSKLPEAPEKAEQWLKRMKEASAEEGEDHVSPPRASLYTNVISAWESSGRPEAPYHGEALWKEIVSQQQASGKMMDQHMDQHPTKTLEAGYHLLLSLWSKSALPEAPQKASELLKDRITQSQCGKVTIVPSCRDFVTVISAWSKKSRSDKEAAYKAQELLEILWNEYDSKRLSDSLNDVPFNATIQAWANSGLPEAWTKVQELILRMKHESERNPSVGPTIVTVWSALQALRGGVIDAKDNGEETKNVSSVAARNATSLLEFIDNEGSNTNMTLRGQIYDHILRLWSESEDPDAPFQAQSILDNLVLQEPKQSRRFDSTMACFCHVLECWRKRADNPEASNHMIKLLKKMRNETDLMYNYNINGSSAAVKRLTAYVHILRAWANSGLPQGTDEAKAILELMLTQSKTVPEYDAKIEDWFRILIRGLVRVGRLDQAEHVFRHVMPALLKETGWDNNYSPTASFYGELVEAWSKSNLPGASDRARKVLEEMIDLYEAGSERVKPSAIYFAPVITRYADQGDINMVEQLCDRLQVLRYNSLDDQDCVDFLPNGEILAALSTAGGDRAAREAAVLHLVLERARVTNGVGPSNELPSNAAFDSVLDSLSKSGLPSAGQLAETILLKLQELHDDGSRLDKPNFATFQKVIACWTESEMEGASRRAEEILQLAEELYEAGDNNELKPTFEGYMSVVDAVSHSYDSDAPERILRHMRKMQQLSKADDTNVLLDGRPHAALARAYSLGGRNDAALLAQKVVDETPEALRSTDLYNSLIRAQGGDSNRAEAILDEMQKAFLRGNELIKPNTESFNNVILAWSKSGSPMAAWRADGIFQRMAELSVGGRLDVRPNGTTFDLVIATLANDWGSDSAAKVDRYLELLKELYESGERDCVPSVTSYTEAIRAWGDHTDDPRAVLRAKALLDEMHELAKSGIHSAKPDRHTYAVFLKALALSSVSDKAQLAEDVVLSMKENNVELDHTALTHLYHSMSGGFPSSSWTVRPEGSAEFPSAMSPRKEKNVSSLLVEDQYKS